jgi:hypothetical protein
MRRQSERCTWQDTFEVGSLCFLGNLWAGAEGREGGEGREREGRGVRGAISGAGKRTLVTGEMAQMRLEFKNNGRADALMRTDANASLPDSQMEPPFCLRSSSTWQMGKKKRGELDV